jgi:8-oxo-dGTP pyrophosphatase MutT (NUDIX family)
MSEQAHDLPRTGDDTTVVTVEDGVARVSWTVEATESGEIWAAVDVVRRAVEAALEDHGRVETWVRADDSPAQRIATWAGMRREGVMRGVDGDRIVYARLQSDAPASEPEGFRALLNSFLPRKRAISQLLARDPEGRVLMCQLTYKQDWDLPGGVVEVGESPQLAVTREVEEELGLRIAAGPLVLTDWLPPWGGWDDALCLVFDGGVHEPGIVADVVRQEREIRTAAFLTVEQVRERAADFTARRIEAALAALDRGAGAAYTESGR